MFSSIHNRFSVATETKFGAIPPTFLSMAEEVKEPELSIANDVLTEMEETVDSVTEDMVVENITMSLCQAPEPIESKEIEDEVFEKYTPISNNPLFVEPADFVLDDIYATYDDDDNFEEQKPAKKKRSVLKTFMNEFKPTYRKRAKKNKSVL